MWHRWGLSRHRKNSVGALARGGVVIYLGVLLVVGGPFSPVGMVQVQRAFLASETIPLTEESEDTELAAPRSSARSGLVNHIAPQPRQTMRGRRHRQPVLTHVPPRAAQRQPDLPCGVTVPLLC
jgi:hypothetical protein